MFQEQLTVADGLSRDPNEKSHIDTDYLEGKAVAVHTSMCFKQEVRLVTKISVRRLNHTASYRLYQQRVATT